MNQKSSRDLKRNHANTGAWPRREFLKVTGISAASLLTRPFLRSMAGPFENVNEYLRVIPQDKRLHPDWIQSLYERGRKEVYSDPGALRHIGMPVGGLFAGTVYLGGDGRLWLWDIFNRDQEGIVPRQVSYAGATLTNRDGANYVDPATPQSPLAQGFALAVEDQWRRLDLTGFSQVKFEGRYPIGHVSYRDAQCPVAVDLEAFSPFIPLDAADSSLPVTIMRYTVKNESDRVMSCELRGWLENAVAMYHRDQVAGRRSNRILRESGLTWVECSAVPAPLPPPSAKRPDILFADFENDRYEGWSIEGTAFGQGPVPMSQIPSYQGEVGGRGTRVVNSHATAPGSSVTEKDGHTGSLTSPLFVIERRFITFLIGGGAHAGRTCVNLLVDGKVVASATGRNNNRMGPGSFSTGRWEGQQAQLQVVDAESGGWGNIGLDHIVFTDEPATPPLELERLHDFGTMVLAVLADGNDPCASAAADEQGRYEAPLDQASVELASSLTGAVGQKVSLAPGEEKTVTFVVAWHFPNFYARGVGGRRVGHAYAARFDDATAVARYVAAHYARLHGETRRWVETWYDSTLPYWLLDRTMANTSTLATTTCYRFEDGRFWAWEGIGCCQGTCTHVWHYAQAPGRLFPEMERHTRERVDFGISLKPDGGVGMRADLDGANEPADDGQCGRILGVYREHLMSGDDAFLRRLWPKVKRALGYLMDKDGNEDGMIEGAQPNTLDAAWYGKISFLASLYLAALRAGQAMAEELEDAAFAQRCRRVAEQGARSIEALYNGEYYIQQEDPKHKDQIGVGPGCYIDQVFGQTWAHWVGLGTLFNREHQLSALRALYRYNFVPDIGVFRKEFQRGRWYATAGDAGLLMCTWPLGGQNPNFHQHWQYMYFNECMTGFEWQAASHMVWEGHDQPDLLQDGLAVARAIHDRYHAGLRNPYNEVECSDHYARAMASYGLFQAACGYSCHGPQGRLEFAPRLAPERFRCAFTAAEGWGSFAQDRRDASQENRVELKWGRLRLRTLTVTLPEELRPGQVRVWLEGQPVQASFRREGRRFHVVLDKAVTLQAGQNLRVLIS